MPKFKGQVFILLIKYFIYITLIGCSLTGCQRPVEESNPIVAHDEIIPALESWSVNLAESRVGMPRFRIEAAQMIRYEQKDSTWTIFKGGLDSTLTNQVRAFLYDEEGQLSAELTANKLTYYDLEKYFEARGKVIVLTNESRELITEHLRWDEAGRRISTEGFVQINTPDEEIAGYKLNAAEDLSDYELEQVSGRGVFVEENTNE